MGAVIKRTIEISQNPAYLAVRDGQLLLRAQRENTDTQPDRDPDGAGSSRRGARAQHDPDHRPTPAIPCEDIGVLLVDHPAVTYSHGALTTLLEHDAAVVLCGRNHLPIGLLLPIAEHSQVVWRVQAQINVPKPVRKRLWQQIIRAKIRAQAANLLPDTLTRTKLLGLARNVRSGDPDNLEAQAARAYWPAWLQTIHAEAAGRAAVPDFRRDADGPAPNNLLNYGYAVLRAAVARALVCAGLFPALGLKHSNRSNAFCLADDLVEPLRPMVDAAVSGLARQGVLELGPDSKKALLGLLASDVELAGQTGPLMVALHRFAASLAKCLDGDAEELEIPVACT